jgi:hypothetical protein
MRRFVDESADDHPADGDKATANWLVAVNDDCEACGELRVVLTIEERDHKGEGIVAHLGADTTRRLRAALATALREIGEQA